MNRRPAMDTPGITVHKLAIIDEAQWSFREREPRWGDGTWDPFPAYPHDLAVAIEAAAHVQRYCPPLWHVEMYLADREETGRSNGYSNVNQPQHRNDDGTWVKDPPVGLIVLSGKRIPPHPAMTRYLVAHEYGHNLAWMLGHVRGANLYDDDLMQDYAAMRALPPDGVHHGSGGRWHDSLHEVFACDFRIHVAGVEPEFWPHPGIARPERVDQLDAWWQQALADLDHARVAAALS